jgi:glycosyltransferase involved in cell wall biosynthesis
MRISFLSTSGQLGGAESSLLDVLASLRAARPAWRLQLVIASDGPLAARAEALGVTALTVPFPPSLARLGEHAAVASGAYATFAAQVGLAARPTASYLTRLGRVIAAFGPDVVHTNGVKMHLLGAHAAGETPIVWHVHDYLGRRRITARLLRWNLSRCAAIIANSRSVAYDVGAALGNSVAVVPVHNAVDLQTFSPDGPVADLDRLAGLAAPAPGTIRVGLVATYARWKGHAAFLAAIAKLPSDIGVRAYIVGGAVYQTDGSQYSAEELNDLAKASGVADRVAVTGLVMRPETAMRALDIVVHASTAPEPFGLVIAEAMACGRATIVSCAGGAAELVTPDVDALTHSPGDVNGLAHAIEQLARDASRRARLGNAARATAERRFDRGRLAHDLIPVYETALRRRRTTLDAPAARL